MEDNRFINCSVSESGGHEFAVTGSKVAFDTWRLRSCALWNATEGKEVRVLGTSYGVPQAKQQWPQVFAGAIRERPIFLAPVASDFRQAQTSPLRGKGEPLALVTGDGHGVRVPVSDNLPFCDGWGLSAGDKIRVGDELVRVVGSEEPGHLTLDRAIDFESGDPIFQAAAGPSPDIGLYNMASLSVQLPAPTAVNAAAKPAVAVSWAAVPGAMVYQLERRRFEGSTWGPWAFVVVAAERSYADKDVENGAKYRYRVRALANDSTPGAWSLEAEATA
jgi:hypothetical protein